MTEAFLTGGCQCGAIRYALDQEPVDVHVCHCRMCQKASGGPFAVIVPVPKTAFRVTRGAFSYFMSSDLARRGFCGACGTPLSHEFPEGADIGVLVGTLDDPDKAPPVNQYGNESRVSWYPAFTGVPGTHPTFSGNPEMRDRIARSSHQHPDHDTETWPERPRS